MIGQRLKIARAAAGLSLRDLEAAVKRRVTAQAIGEYERNEDMPSSRVLSALASALNVSEDYLLASDELVLDGVGFRKNELASKREEAFLEGQALHLLERYLAVEDALNLASVCGTARGKPLIRSRPSRMPRMPRGRFVRIGVSASTRS